jgi:hypothetical protein
VKSGYSEHLRDLGLVSSHFVPAVISATGLWTGARKAFKLDMWSIHDFHISCKQYPGLLENWITLTMHCVVFDPDADPALALFAAHVYHRSLTAVPSLIRMWLEACKDRNLHTAFSTYTAQHFSPVIVSQELAQVRDPATLKELSDENFAVKVLGTANEVMATYTVDEKTLELSLKLPSDWPLHAIEIRDTKRIGVAEDKWRAWILGIQQIIWSSVSSIQQLLWVMIAHFIDRTEQSRTD